MVVLIESYNIVSGCMDTRLLILSGSIGTESSDGNDRV